MPYCPRCRSEYREGFARCADCDVDLVPALPALPPADGWAEVFRGTVVQADIAAAAIESAGIETLTPDEFTATLGWTAPGSSHAFRVLVRVGEAARAKEILASGPPPDEA